MRNVWKDESKRQRRVVPMKHAPSLNSIEERLDRALAQFGTSLGDGAPIAGIPVTSGRFEEAVKTVLQRKEEWLAAVLASRTCRTESKFTGIPNVQRSL